MGCMLATKISEGIMNFWNMYIVEPIRNFGVSDALDILILTAILYGVYMFLKGRRAAKLALGLVFILAFYALSDIFHFRAVYQLLSGIAPFGIVLLAVIFQPEIRDALEQLGSSPFGFLLGGSDQDRSTLIHTISEVVEAACQIAQNEQDGALIVIECSTPLGEYASKGQMLDAQVSSSLLANIFVNRSPMHDGAVLIRNNRVVAAGCKLPLTTNEEVARGMGTRHRAAIGVSEVSDCVVVVVSEERHIISVANSGFIKRDYNKNANDFRNEETLKLIQNSLRQDLFLLLAGMPLEKSEREGKRYALKDAQGDRAKKSKGGKTVKAAKGQKADSSGKAAKPHKDDGASRHGTDERELRADVIPTPAPVEETEKPRVEAIAPDAHVNDPAATAKVAAEGDFDTAGDA